MPAATIPPSAPMSNPISATHGANVITPSWLDQENAIISPHVAAMPAIARNVTKYRRRANDTTTPSVVFRRDIERRRGTGHLPLGIPPATHHRLGPRQQNP